MIKPDTRLVQMETESVQASLIRYKKQACAIDFVKGSDRQEASLRMLQVQTLLDEFKAKLQELDRFVKQAQTREEAAPSSRTT